MRQELFSGTMVLLSSMLNEGKLPAENVNALELKSTLQGFFLDGDAHNDKNALLRLSPGARRIALCH